MSTTLRNIPEGGATGVRLTHDSQVIERLEADLVKKCKNALGKYGLGSFVFGVFSVDDLESKRRDDLCGKIAVGIGYSRTTPQPPEQASRDGALNPSRGAAAKTLLYEMTAILAVPSGSDCDERSNATTVLSAMRLSILGSTVAGDQTNRTWDFVKEGPEVAASTDTMLYYTQVWRVAIQCVGVSN